MARAARAERVGCVARDQSRAPKSRTVDRERVCPAVMECEIYICDLPYGVHALLGCRGALSEHSTYVPTVAGRRPTCIPTFAGPSPGLPPHTSRRGPAL
eukprot:6613353-Prymnesium_polylepis.1